MDDKQINNNQATDNTPADTPADSKDSANASIPSAGSINTTPTVSDSAPIPDTKTDPPVTDIPSVKSSTPQSADQPKTDPPTESINPETKPQAMGVSNPNTTTGTQVDSPPATTNPPTANTESPTAANAQINNKPSDEHPTDDERARTANTDFTGKRILLVEDDEGLAEVYTTRLDVEGFKIKRVPNGEDALAATMEFKPDLILLDVMMPKVSGFEVLDILRNTPSTTKIKIIMLTALSQDSDREKAQALGVDDYLVKSQVVIADVVDRIKAALSS